MLPESNLILSKMGAIDIIDQAGFLPKCGATFKWQKNGDLFTETFTKSLSKITGLSGCSIPPYSWQISRDKYDSLLLQHAENCGVEVRQRTLVTDINRKNNRVTSVVARLPNGSVTTISCQFIVDCSGQARFLGRKLGLGSIKSDLGDLAFYGYFSEFRWREDLNGQKELSRIYITMTRNGWAWFIPISTQVASCGVVTKRALYEHLDPESIFHNEVFEVPELASMLVDAELVSTPGSSRTPAIKSVQNWGLRYNQLAGPGWYLGGDAGCFVDPILSSGVCVAHNSGLAIANAINTEINHSEIDSTALHQAYTDSVHDLWSGFQTMAAWWYTQRDQGIEGWWKTAAQLADGYRGVEHLNDMGKFIAFLSGYLADFRFKNTGVGFGAEGLRQVLNGMQIDESHQETIAVDFKDRDALIRYSLAEPPSVECYLATDLESERWWKLPTFEFKRDEDTVVYRPAIRISDNYVTQMKLLPRVLTHLLQLSDGSRSSTRKTLSFCN